MLDCDQLVQRLRQRAVVDRSTGCWLWRGAADRDGYGVLAVGQRRRQRLVRVQRLAVWLWLGRPLAGKGVVGACPQSRRCFHPEHLVWHASRAKAQLGRTQRQGQANGRAKLTEAEARRLLEVYQRQALSPEELARLVGGKVRPATVAALLKGRTWKHLPRPRPG
jgi:hypothetical protein